MENFIIKLAVAVIPLIVLVVSVTIFANLSLRHSRHPLSWHRRQRSILRTLAAGSMLRGY